MIEFFKDLTEQYKWAPELLAIALAFFMFFQNVRKWSWISVKWLWGWFVFPFKGQENISKILTELGNIKIDLKKNTEISEKTAQDVNDLKKVVGHNGGGGLLDMVGVLAGFQSSDFWLRAQPGFVCDQDGRNVDITHAYSLLLKLSSKTDLIGISWKSYTDWEKSEVYLNEFKDAAERRESFRGKLELFDVNATSKGFWIVIAHPISAEKAKAKRYIGFLYPADELSRDIAKSYNWPLSVPL